MVNTTGTRILVVDDEPGVRRNIEKILDRAGYESATAKNGLEAIKLMENQFFHLVLLDVMMPDWTGKLSPTAGVDLLKEMRQKGWETPVVMLTASKSVGTAVESMKFGAYDYLEKGSVNSSEFVLKINDALAQDPILSPTPNISQNTQKNSSSTISPDWKQWLIERSGGLVDEVLGAAVVGIILYIVGNIAGIFDSSQATIWIYGFISLIIIVILLLVYMWWQRKNRRH